MGHSNNKNENNKAERKIYYLKNLILPDKKNLILKGKKINKKCTNWSVLMPT